MGKHVKKKASPARNGRDSAPLPEFPEEWDDAGLTDDFDAEADLDLDAFLADEPPLPELDADTPEEFTLAEEEPAVEEVPVAGDGKLPPLENVVPVKSHELPRARREVQAEKAPARKDRAGENEDRKRNAASPAKNGGKGNATKSNGALRKKNSKASRRRSARRFRRGLLLYAIILLAIIAAVLVVLWRYLDKYQRQKDIEDAEFARRMAEQAAQEAHAKAVYRAPQLAFESWLAQTGPDYWTELWYQKSPEDIDGRDRVWEFMNETFDPGTAEAFKSLDYTDTQPVYVLKNGEETLARITLTGGDVQWSVSNVELLIEGTKSASVRVAAGSTVLCNGKELGEEYAGEPTSYFRYEPLRETLANPVSWVTYTVDGMLLEPELTVIAPEGRSVTQTAEGDYLLCLDGDVSSYQEKSVNFVRSYLYYYMRGGSNVWGNLYNVLAHLTPGTQAYKDVYDSEDGVYWNTPYEDIDTSDTVAGDVVIWADNCYSVDVTYNARGRNPYDASRQIADYDSATMRIYFVNYGNGFIISNFETL